MNASTKTFSAYFNYIGSIELSLEIAEMCSHSGDCSEDIDRCMELPEIKVELEGIDPKELVKELEEYGAWDKEELTDHTENLRRILWIASGNITEEAPIGKREDNYFF